MRSKAIRLWVRPTKGIIENNPVPGTKKENVSKVFPTLRYRVTEKHRALSFKFTFSV
jgi:hypothetical protein